MEISKISSIHIDYSDGSYDIIKPIQEDPILISSLERTNADGDRIINRAHTNGAIAALLFMTVFSNQRTEYFSHDPKVGALLNAWKAATEENPNN